MSLPTHNILWHPSQISNKSWTGAMERQRIDKQTLFDRPDCDRIETIENANGIIISARMRDTSILSYLLKINRADHGHERAANTYLDWQLG